MGISLLIILGIVIGSKPMPEDNVAVIYGKVNTSAVTGESTVFTTVKIDFPEGFNKDNCVVVSTGIKRTSENNGYSFEHTSLTDPRTWLRGGIGRIVTFNYHNDGKITFSIETPFTEAYEFEYKIVLMKIEPDVSNYELGDVNMDGQVTEADYTLLQNYLNGTGTLNEKQFKLADMDSN